jgi:hypothetical protein
VLRSKNAWSYTSTPNTPSWRDDDDDDDDDDDNSNNNNKNEKKSKLSLCLTKYNAMNMYRALN